ncbi:MAG: hypothetical protein AAGB07_18655, partial [Pseudomonadota bacterium]
LASSAATTEGPVEAMPKHKQAGQTTVLTKTTAKITRKHLQCRSHPQRRLAVLLLSWPTSANEHICTELKKRRKGLLEFKITSDFAE